MPAAPSRTDPLPARDLARLALAVDALAIGAPWPMLVHTDLGPDPSVPDAPVEIGLTPLSHARRVHDVLAQLNGWVGPPGWQCVGLCCPVRVTTVAPASDPLTLEGWIVHLVDRSGARASRLCVPGVEELSGPTSAVPVGSAFDRACRHVLGLGD